MAGRHKGTPKTGGRVKGSLNKKTIHFDLQAKCDALGVDPFQKLLEYMVYPCEPDIRLQAIKEACKYLYPQRKAVEHSGEIANPYLEKSVEELEALVKAKLKEKK